MNIKTNTTSNNRYNTEDNMDTEVKTTPFKKEMKNDTFKTYFVDQLPTKTKYEIAFIGRSNVGKSSLLNAIFGNKTSRVSKSPGCTKWIGWYPFHNLTLIDLPGYGYANLSKKQQGLISTMVSLYFEKNRVDELYILIDARRGIMDIDKEVINYVIKQNILFKVIATKIDKRDAKEIKSVFQVSSKSKKGIQEVVNYFKSIKPLSKDHTSDQF